MNGLTITHPTSCSLPCNPLTATFNMTNAAVTNYFITIQSNGSMGNGWAPGGGSQQFSTPVAFMLQAAAPPTITSITPSDLVVGETNNVTIIGSGFSSTPVLTTGNITASNVARVNATTITATFQVPDDDVGGDQDVIVRINGIPSNTFKAYEQVPTKLIRFSAPGAPGGIGPLQKPVNEPIVDLAGTTQAINACGVYQNFAYAFADQRTTPTRIIRGLAKFDEIFANLVVTGGAAAPQPASENFNLATDRPTDILAVAFTYPHCPAIGDAFTVDQRFTVKIGTGKTRLLTTVTHVSVGADFAGELYVDHDITTP